MKPPRSLCVAFLLLLCGSVVSCGQVLPEAKVTVQAVDDTGAPVADAKVGMGFVLPGKISFSTSGVAVEGKTDASGKFTGAARCLGEMGYRVDKPGYYEFTAEPYRFPKSFLGRWEPYDSTFRAVLKKIGNPVPMYAKQRNVVDVPVLDETVGYDLIISDWVAPYGKGTNADFIFKAHRRFVDYRDYDALINLTFANPGDGIQEAKAKPTFGSALRLDRLAPVVGYLPQCEFSLHQVPGNSEVTTASEDANYYFRVRTVMKDGEVISALYGKIHGDILIDPINSKTCSIVFSYFINPDGTTNLEYDSAHNLFINLPRSNEPSNL